MKVQLITANGSIATSQRLRSGSYRLTLTTPDGRTQTVNKPRAEASSLFSKWIVSA